MHPGFSHLIRQQHDGQDHLHRVQNALEHQAIADLLDLLPILEND